MEWVSNWYVERLYLQETELDSLRDAKTYKVLRGGGYTSQGVDLRITSRMFMVPDFRDETIGFRCASSDGKSNPKNGQTLKSKMSIS